MSPTLPLIPQPPHPTSFETTAAACAGDGSPFSFSTNTHSLRGYVKDEVGIIGKEMFLAAFEAAIRHLLSGTCPQRNIGVGLSRTQKAYKCS
jgi:hypothetical protein